MNLNPFIWNSRTGKNDLSWEKDHWFPGTGLGWDEVLLTTSKGKFSRCGGNVFSLSWLWAWLQRWQIYQNIGLFWKVNYTSVKGIYHSKGSQIAERLLSAICGVCCLSFSSALLNHRMTSCQEVNSLFLGKDEKMAGGFLESMSVTTPSLFQWTWQAAQSR